MELYFLDAQTNDKTERITSFGGDIESLARDFQNWLKEKSLKPSDIWYADIFRHIEKNKERHAYTLTLQENGDILIKEPDRVVKNPYKRRKGLFR